VRQADLKKARTWRLCTGLWVVMIAMLCRPHEARADGWKIQLQGGKALGAAYAGRSVLFDDASVTWFNPSGMTALDGDWTLSAAAPLITYQLDYQDTGSFSVLGQALQGDASPDGGTTAAVPHVYLVKRLNARWRLGFGFNAPYGLGTNYGETWVGRYHATETTLTVFNLNPSLAVRLNDRVSLGFGLDVQRSTATLANMIDFGSVGAALGLPLAPQGHDGKVEFKGSDWAAGFDVSVWAGLTEDMRLGVAYRSQIDHTLSGTADFTVPSEAAALTAGGVLFADTGARTILPMPHELSISASHQPDDEWLLLGDFTWTRWSVFRQLLLVFDNTAQLPVRQAADWDDGIRLAIGARRRIDARWSVRAGLAYETVPVPDETRTPRLPEDDNTWLSAGATYASAGRWSLDFYFSHLITPDAPLLVRDPAAGQLDGTVHWRLNVFGAAINVGF
jgi:long-chain fatty acid transport protein